MLKKLKQGSDSTAPPSEGEISFLDQLDELRTRIIRSLIAIVAIAVVVYALSSFIFEYLIFAPSTSEFITFKLFCKHVGLCFGENNFTIKTVALTESFFVDLKVAFYLGLIFSFPYIFYQIWQFVKPGLYQKEQKATRGVVVVCSLLFFTGVLFGYIILAPFAIKFLGNYTVGQVVQNEVSLSNYVGALTMFVIPSGIMFQLPLVIFFLARLGIITHLDMKKYRKHAFVTILFLSAILTPPDVITQFLISVPIYGLYEVSIYIAKRETKKLEERMR